MLSMKIEFSVLRLIPESARWLASKGKLKQASNVIRKAAKVNKANVSEKILSLQDLQLEGQQRNIYHMLFSPTLLIRSIVIFYNWLVNYFDILSEMTSTYYSKNNERCVEIIELFVSYQCR